MCRISKFKHESTTPATDPIPHEKSATEAKKQIQKQVI